MECETINRVELLDTGELLLGIESHGKSSYEYVYREAAGVYWDQSKHGFKSTKVTDWSCSQWCEHIIAVVRSGLGVNLVLSSEANWLNVSERDKSEIQRKMAD